MLSESSLEGRTSRRQKSRARRIPSTLWALAIATLSFQGWELASAADSSSAHPATAIKQGDYSKADRIAGDVLARSHMEPWRFYPFNEFMTGVVRGDDDPVLLQHLHAWLEREPKSRGRRCAEVNQSQSEKTLGGADRV